MKTSEEAAYQAALGRVAGDCGMTPDQLEKEIKEAAEGIKFTPDCLTLKEFDMAVNSVFASEYRFKHVLSCSTCKKILEAFRRKRS